MKKQEGSIHFQNFLLQYCAISDRGMVRKENEDNFLIAEQHNLFCVADGMGGAEAGKLASRITLESFVQIVGYLSAPDEVTMPLGLPNSMLSGPILINSVNFANSQVQKKSEGKKMGSTIVAAQFTDAGLNTIHVGDSRLYLFRNRKLQQLTEDHSLVYELYKSGKITREEMDRHQMKNIITRAIGTNETVEPDSTTIPVQHGDVFLLCSDGLTNMMDESTIEQGLVDISDIPSLAHFLISQANARGGKDNITVLIISVC